MLRKPIVVIVEIIIFCSLVITIAWLATISFELMRNITVSLGALAIAFVLGYATNKGCGRR